MLAGIVSGDFGQACFQVALGRGQRYRLFRFVQRGGDAPPAPGAAEVEPVQMGDLSIRAVADMGRREQDGGRPLGQARQISTSLFLWSASVIYSAVGAGQSCAAMPGGVG